MARKIWISAIAAGAALAAASPSMANERGTAATAGASTASAVSAAAEEKKDERVCLVTRLTGSRIARKVCRTELEWEKDGVDIQKEMTRAK